MSKCQVLCASVKKKNLDIGFFFFFFLEKVRSIFVGYENDLL